MDYLSNDWIQLVIDENGNVFHGHHVVYEWALNRGGALTTSGNRGIAFIGTAGDTYLIVTGPGGYGSRQTIFQIISAKELLLLQNTRHLVGVDVLVVFIVKILGKQQDL